MNYHLDSDIEAFVINEISNFIKDNLQLLLRFNNYEMRYIKEYCIEKKYNYNDIDGVKVTFTYGWASVRASNTGPNITSRFEAIDDEKLNAIKEEFETLIKKYNK